MSTPESSPSLTETPAEARAEAKNRSRLWRATALSLGIVLLAITLDRITQSLGRPRRGVRHWWHTGPAGLVLRTTSRLVQPLRAAQGPGALPALR